MGILEELWYGRLCPMEQADYKSREYCELISLYQRNEEKLLSGLNQAQQEDFEKMRELTEEMESMAECAGFKTGFRLAVQLMSQSV